LFDAGGFFLPAPSARLVPIRAKLLDVRLELRARCQPPLALPTARANRRNDFQPEKPEVFGQFRVSRLGTELAE